MADNELIETAASDVFDKAVDGERGAKLLRQMWPLVPLFEALFEFLGQVPDSDRPLWTEFVGKDEDGNTVESGLRLWATSKGHTPVNRAIELSAQLTAAETERDELKRKLAEYEAMLTRTAVIEFWGNQEIYQHSGKEGVWLIETGSVVLSEGYPMARLVSPEEYPTALAAFNALTAGEKG